MSVNIIVPFPFKESTEFSTIFAFAKFKGLPISLTPIVITRDFFELLINGIKYETFSLALESFKLKTDKKMEVDRIDFYVPGKLPREDGDPYFIGRGTIDENKNDCIVGYMNLVTGVTESHHDVCIIYN